MRRLAIAVLAAVIAFAGGMNGAGADNQPVTADVQSDDSLPDASCAGTLNGYFGNVTVPAGQSCTLNLATVQHDVTVGQGASLTVIGQAAPNSTAIAVTIGGSIVAKGCAQVTLDGSLGGIAVRHQVQIVQCTEQSGFSGPGVMIGGNFACTNNLAPCKADQGTVVGNVVIRNNVSVSPSDISGNIIGGDLSCSRNFPDPTLTGNQNNVAGTVSGQCGAPFASSSPPANCSGAVNLAKVPDMSVMYAQVVAATSSQPEYCQLVGAVLTRGDGGPSSAGFLLRLPTTWNNRFVFMGCGGSCGSIGTRSLTTGIVSPSLSVNGVDSGEALGLGYAVVNTDTGHEPIAGSNLQQWALLSVGVSNIPAVYDNQYRSVHDITVAAKQMVSAYYNDNINYAYFDGCSTGGRQAMVEATRYPEDYDGVISGDPVFDYDTITASVSKGYSVWLAPGAFISSTDIANLDAAVLANCDALDGVTDGLIQNPQACTLDPNALAGTTLTQAQATAVVNFILQVFDTDGRSVYPGFSLGHWATTGTSSFINFQNKPAPFPTSPQPWSVDGKQITSGSISGPTLFTLSDPGTRYQVFLDPNFDTINSWPEGANIGQPANVISSDVIQLRTLRNHRGAGDDPRKLHKFLSQNRKLIMYHGFSDNLATPYRTIWYYRELAALQKSYAELQNNARLFMVPGMGHCSGGTSPNSFDTLQTLVNWVENGVAPDSLPATNNTTHASMPLCKFPEMATYVSGPTTSASSWTCNPSDQRLLTTPGHDGLLAGMDHNDQNPGAH